MIIRDEEAYQALKTLNNYAKNRLGYEDFVCYKKGIQSIGELVKLSFDDSVDNDKIFKQEYTCEFM